MTIRFMVATALITSGLVHAQTPKQPAFEVASIKRNVSGVTSTSYRTPPTGIVNITNATLRRLIARAYQLDPLLERFQLVVAANTPLVRGDNDLDDSSAPRFDIQAKIPDTAQPGEQYEMLRTLLMERFTLRAHRESPPVPVYALTVAREGRLGPRLLASSANCVAFQTERSKNTGAEQPRGPDGQPLCFASTAPAPGMIAISSAGPISELVKRLQLGLDRPLLDGTRLSGNFAWALSFEGPMNSFDALKSGPMFTALQEQLGLKLEARTAPYEVLVIDSVEMPSGN